MKATLTVITVLAALWLNSAYAVGPRMQALEEGAEVQSLVLNLTSDNSGHISARICDQCKWLTLTVTDKTLAFVKKRPISMKEAVARSGEGATVMFDTQSLLVTRIVFWFDKDQ